MMDETELKFTGSDFRRARDMLYQKAGIALHDSKKHMVYARLARRVRSRGLRSFGEYLDLLQQDQEEGEWQGFINALTTNLTSFFREPHHFEMLREHVRRRRPAGETFRVWSAASSTGEEPYSIAITLLESWRESGGGAFELLASDIDTQALAQAARGVYPLERVVQLAPHLLKRYFDKGAGANEGMARLKRQAREAALFFQFNLAASTWPDIGRFDVIFCRNVLIYFDKATQADILSRMAPCLKPDGLLFLGHSENISHLTEAFAGCGRTAYRLARPDGG
ncbi:methyltransferase domain-containing protein [Chromobacterium subtsugae]|uniref:Chemotaxis protein methyltransferase n=1 Tax=Chromobacterium subtsugae TaxID=251747 RepID=A0ABS7FA40_9NEIS|nr:MULTISPECIES: CheR family methyltransferase [Chromobacterium]KUM04487.1 chemotaxis protein CheR [Chromobacterium subtsugae]KZE87056.1 chemotaxis protein CheR [Chromobacterium sp. F49]MBW7566007.1 methyltransferase domain-containing protein [Chromobacterium subtsugae]MBW8286953.1 methyltransferase domain-containing protein [Chromobacterium subtsugae]OBU88267.1 chemotaxis protein CheR [Chromobacterium subtsugae]